MNMKPSDNIKEFAEGILKRDIAVLSRAITLAESSKDEHRQTAQQLIEHLLPYTGNSVRVGITGVPGVGKSTFIESFGQCLLQKGHRVAVLAVDPSSTLSKGSILGDKTRMEKLSVSANAFIRPSPSGGNLGGVTPRTRESILLCEAAGFDHILIETVGVGQSETEVSNLCDFFLLLMLAGAGDELQGIKRGIMEMADGLAINKADGNNIDKAKNARAEYARAIHLFPPTESGWIPEVKTCSALNSEGIDEVFEMIQKFTTHTKAKGFFDKKRHTQNLSWFESLVEERIRASYFSDAAFLERYKAGRQLVAAGKNGVFAALSSVFR